jgi:type IV pilus assembly protein PilV
MKSRLPARVRRGSQMPDRIRHRTGRRSGAGFTMLELLVSMVIVLLGVLGLAGLIVRSNQAELESYQRTHALMLAQNMADRINANRGVATCYSNGATGMQLGTGYSGTPACGAGTAPQNNRAARDMADWHNQLLGSAESDPTLGNVGAMIGARGCITEINAATRTYMVSIAWQGLVATAASGNLCGQGQYGDENLRRVVTVQVRIGDLL